MPDYPDTPSATPTLLSRNKREGFYSGKYRVSKWVGNVCIKLPMGHKRHKLFCCSLRHEGQFNRLIAKASPGLIDKFNGGDFLTEQEFLDAIRHEIKA